MMILRETCTEENAMSAHIGETKPVATSQAANAQQSMAHANKIKKRQHNELSMEL